MTIEGIPFSPIAREETYLTIRTMKQTNNKRIQDFKQYEVKEDKKAVKGGIIVDINDVV